MTMKELVKQIMTIEGKKHQAIIGDVREILGIIVGIQAVHIKQDVAGPLDMLQNMARRVAEKKVK